MHKGMLVLAFALAATGCASSAQDEVREATTRAPFTTAPTTAQTTLEPTSSLTPSPPAIAGIWIAELGGIVLQFRLETGSTDEVTGVFDSPAEGVTDIPASITADGASVTVEIPSISAVFEGTVTGDSMTGRWEQGGATIPLVFSRETEAFTFARPQEPRPPFPSFASIGIVQFNGWCS